MNPEAMVFVDSTAWIAVASAGDDNHKAASTYFKKVVEAGTLLFTTRFVFAETTIFIRRRVSVGKAIEFGEYLQHSAQVKLLEIRMDLHDKAWWIFRKYRDWRDLSYVDCLSFTVMKDSGIETAFTFDDDFRRYGFRTQPNHL